MAQYRVNVISLQLKGKKIASANSVVDESQLNGNAEELVKTGFIELVEEVAEEKSKATKTESKDDKKSDEKPTETKSEANKK